MMMKQIERINCLDRAWAVLTDEAKQRTSPAHEKLLQNFIDDDHDEKFTKLKLKLFINTGKTSKCCGERLL